MRTSLITNGVLLSERAGELLSSGLRAVSISLNAADAAGYARVCGADEAVYYRVVEGIRAIRRKAAHNGPLLRISSVVTKENVEQIGELIKLAEELKVDSLDLHSLIVYAHDGDMRQILSSSDTHILGRLEEFRRRKYKIKINWPRAIAPLLNPSKLCGELWSWIGVDAEGNTAGCQKAMGASSGYGNVFLEGAPVWNNKFRRELRAGFLTGKFIYGCCRTCTEAQR